ncbi:hypothetical protein K488DRAFT_89193 [Vararia minispora EC-137]|uniref:Uncharacterized protein n=1 Tax=Vararia minispora EC-137 TaxID=1314806 RepID=A0ACB8QBG8_9AGAM|nr:hypothetical protein K488DRAFT_89193 [Vararia minispora EC-137]
MLYLRRAGPRSLFSLFFDENNAKPLDWTPFGDGPGPEDLSDDDENESDSEISLYNSTPEPIPGYPSDVEDALSEADGDAFLSSDEDSDSEEEPEAKRTGVLTTWGSTSVEDFVFEVMHGVCPPRPHFRTLSITSGFRRCEFIFSDPSDPAELAPTLTLCFEDMHDSLFRSRIPGFVSKAISRLPCGVTIARLIVRAPELVYSNEPALDNLVKLLPSVESLEIHVAPVTWLTSGLASESSAMSRLSRVSIVHSGIGELTRARPMLGVEMIASSLGSAVP